VITNVPVGVAVWVGVNNAASPFAAARLTSGEVGEFAAVRAIATSGGYAVAPAVIKGGSAIAVWETLQASPNIDMFDFPVWFIGPSPISVTSLSGSLAPNPSQGAIDPAGTILASSTLPLPRFVPSTSAVVSPVISAVTGGANSIPAVSSISANGYFTVYGVNFVPDAVQRGLQGSDIVDNSLPTNLASTCVSVGRRRAFLRYVSPNQINALAPLLPSSGTVPVSVIFGCGTNNEVPSSAVDVPVAESSPEFLYWFTNSDGRNPVVAVDALTGAYIGPPGLFPGVDFRPARIGDVLTLYGISFGKTASGGPLPGALPLESDMVPGNVSVTIGVRPATFNYLGVTPQSAGLYQLNVTVPGGLTTGNYQVGMTINGISTPTGGFLTVVP
jgi:uncharacterized protein (TIGR03437 family)